MIVDTSAVIAVLRREPEAAHFADLIASATAVKMSAATCVELVNVVDRRIGPEAILALDTFLDASAIEIVPFTPEQARWARHARLTYGIGRSKAGLNFGDCFVYALAKETGEPLLYKGGDFARTDLVAAAV